MTAPTTALTTAPSAQRPPTSVSLLYTVLRHGRGLSHEEASRRIASVIGEVPEHVPAQAS